MYRAIVADDEPLARAQMVRTLNKIECIEVVGEAADGLEALNRTYRLNPDFLFLDIRMPQLNGLEVARRIGVNGPAIFYVTGHGEFAIEASATFGLMYLVKPLEMEAVLQAIEKYRRLIDYKTERLSELTPFSTAFSSESPLPAKPQTLSMKVDGKTRVVVTDEIVMLQSDGRYAEVILDEGSLYTDENLAALAKRLPESFFQVDRCRYINRRFVEEFYSIGNHKYEARLSDAAKTMVRINRTFSREVKKALNV